MADCLIGLGSNLDDRVALLNEAVERFCSHPRVAFVARSSDHRSAPIGGPPGQNDYLNGALRVHTQLPPPELLEWSQLVERQMGRRRSRHWSERRIDIDLLLFEQLQLRTAELTLPHPRLPVRRFVLVPANEIAAEMIHPDTGWKLDRLLKRLSQLPRYIALAGIPGAGKTEFVACVSQSHDDSELRLLLDRPILPPVVNQHLPEKKLHREIERIDSRSRQLTQLGQQSTHSAPHPAHVALSDYWLYQSRAVARALFDTAGQTELERACCNAEKTAPIPHLTLFLDTPIERAWQRLAVRTPATTCGRSTADLARLRDALVIQLQEPGQGPIIHIAAGDLTAAKIELEAAMDAMKQMSENHRTSRDSGDGLQ